MNTPAREQVVLPFDPLTAPLDAGIKLVEASAGTGKTFAITRLVLRLLLERRVASLSQILVVTFTEKATQELVTRIRATLRLAERVWSDAPPERSRANDDLFTLRDTHGAGGRLIIEHALGSLDDLAVYTIHGFCQRILSESALESRIPFRTAFIEDETEPFQRSARDWARTRLLNNHEAAQLIVNDKYSIESWIKCFVAPYRRHQDTRIEHDSASPEQSLVADFVESVDRTFEAEKARRHLMDFDDLLRKLSHVLTEEGPQGALATCIRGRFSAALIDEFQDTDQTQFPIFSNAFDGCPLFLIGDPKQSIYRFRGADIHAYLRAAQSSTTKYTLPRNFRSTPAYVQAVERLFTRAPDPFLVSEQEIGFSRVTAADTPEAPGKLATDGRAAMEWWWVDGSLGGRQGFVSKEKAVDLLIRDIVNEIIRLRLDGLPCRSMAVLLRSNREARQVKQALDKARVPSVVAGDADVLASDEAGEIARLSAAIAAPYDSRAVRSAMATRLWGSTASDIAATLREDGETLGINIAEQFAAARELWRTRGVASAIGALLIERNAAERLLTLPEGERRLTNARHVVELLHEVWASDSITPENVGAWLSRELTVPNVPGRRELRLETDSEAVQILTIHKAKGLQFDVVFCPTLWQSFSSKPGPLGLSSALVVEEDGAVLDIGSPRIGVRSALADDEEAAENLRLAYVALTRAVHRCYVGWGVIGKAQYPQARSALGHLMRSDNDPLVALEQLVKSANGTMSMRQVQADERSGVLIEPTTAESKTEARVLVLAGGQMATWGVSSFTSLTANSHGDDSRDVADPMMLRTEHRVVSTATGFRAFPAGAQSGIALHDVFERLDFRRANDVDARSAVRDMVSRSLASRGLSGDESIAEQRVDDVVEMLGVVCGATIPGATFALGDIAPRSALREWHFHLSVSNVSVRRIADALAQHGSAHAREYAPVLRTLRDSALGGYLNGIVDLIFEHDGRWWIVDWKSNQLGDDDSDYTPEALSLAMSAAHYTLQYHLYMVALHRHLRARVPQYDPAQHWGGVAYVFLRGVNGVDDAGWFRDTPTPALLDALDAALGMRV